jgi:hypothetical protein
MILGLNFVKDNISCAMPGLTHVNSFNRLSSFILHVCICKSLPVGGIGVVDGHRSEQGWGKRLHLPLWLYGTTSGTSLFVVYALARPLHSKIWRRKH